MKFLEFRIKNFRSIVDTGWCPFSPDGVTVLVGQNESGKTSVLRALSCTFSQEVIDDDDIRIGQERPEVRVRVGITYEELAPNLRDFSQIELRITEEYLRSKSNILELRFSWIVSVKGDRRTFEGDVDLDDTDLAILLSSLGTDMPEPVETAYHADDPDVMSESETVTHLDDTLGSNITNADSGLLVVPDLSPIKSTNDVALAAYWAGPTITLFDQKSGLLPDRVDIIRDKNGRWSLSGDGAHAAANYLKIAGVNLEELVTGDTRVRENVLRKANARVTADFATFWSQTIGKKDRLQLECLIANYGSENAGKSGTPHLTFWVSNGFSRLYPKQRSEGVRWFVSFYLQLKASENARGDRLFLLDEPGANLHSKAQADVLKLVNQLGPQIPIVYSTHSPDMIEYEKLYRVLAVQRDGEQDDSPTTVIQAHKLGAASRDTLSPILNAMGVNLANQQVIKKSNNVLLEEISGFYYFTSFWSLCSVKQEAHFIAATGASNVEHLANMFLGWGLDFIVALDDDPHGREVYKKLKRFIYGDDDETAKTRMFKIADCPGIEDVFTKKDFIKFVLPKGAAEFAESNSAFVKKSEMSKPVLAYQFAIRVRKGEINFDEFEGSTKSKIQELVEDVVSRLKPKRVVDTVRAVK
jgi:energy-coupling factor transporter ATP-binding protein EcfA2